MRRGLQAAVGVALAAVALAVLLLEGCDTQAAVTAEPLSIKAGLDGVKRSITNWPEFAAANNLKGWGADPAVPPCLYTGVTCDADGQLQGLSLQCPRCTVQAEGVLAPDVAWMSTLATFNIQQNKLTGPLPPEYGDTGALPNLLHLVISSNLISGSIPDEWSNPQAFPRLTLLSLSANQLSGTLPGDLAFPSLLILRANGNNFTGPLPLTWGTNISMPAVRVVSLQGNALTGQLPPEWAEQRMMHALEEMYLQDNQLTGGLPEEWGSYELEGLPALRVLNLSNNPLGGTLPYQWSQQQAFPSLKTLVLSNTSLEGRLPTSWDCLDASRCGLSNLQTLWLDGNNLSGPVPPSWGSLTTLQVLFVRPGNDLLCKSPDSDFSFRICDAAGADCPETVELGACEATADCQNPVDLADCSAMYLPPAAEPVPPAGATSAKEDAAAADDATAGSEGGGSSRVAAIVGGVVGGLAAAAAAAAAAQLLLRRQRRQRQRKRELPFYAGEQGDKSSFQEASALEELPPPRFPPGMPRPDQPPPQDGPSRSSSLVLLASPSNAMVAELEQPSPGKAVNGLPGVQQHLQTLAQCSSASAGTFAMLMGGDASAVATAEGTDINLCRELNAAIDHQQSVEMTPLETGPTVSSPKRSSQRTSHSTASPSPRLTPPSKSCSTSSHLLQWEDSVPLSDWQITPSEIEIAKRPDGSDWELGSGGFGKVYKALRHSAQPVAIKVLASVSEATQYQSQEDFKREIAILRACRDPNIVAFLGACLQPDRTMLVTEYCAGGNLTRNLMAGRVTWYCRGKKIALDVARGLTYLHSRRIIHFDLKSPNILLARDGTAKISDVGMAKIMAREYSGITGNVGTLAWAAPEMLMGARCSERADIYSFGVVLWEIVTGMTPIRGQLRDVRVPEECPPEVRELILDCLATNSRKRPSAVEIVERLRAMPDPRPPRAAAATAPQAAGPLDMQQQRPQRQASLDRQHSAGTAAVRLTSTTGSPAAAAAAAAAEPTVVERQHEVPMPLTFAFAATRQHVPTSQRSSEESNVSVLEAEGGEAATQPLKVAYARPVSGSVSAEAAARLAQAGSAATASLDPPPRPSSILLASLPRQHRALLLDQQVSTGRMFRASSSPPGTSLWHEWRASPPGTAPASPGAATGRPSRLGPRPPRPTQRTMHRQHSLDAPGRKLGELQHGLTQLPSLLLQTAGPRGPTGSPPVPLAPLVQQPETLQETLRRSSGQLPSGLQQEDLGLGRVSDGKAGEAEEAPAVQGAPPPHHPQQQQKMVEGRKEERRILAVQQWTAQEDLATQQRKEQRGLQEVQLLQQQRLDSQQQGQRQVEWEGRASPTASGEVAEAMPLEAQQHLQELEGRSSPPMLLLRMPHQALPSVAMQQRKAATPEAVAAADISAAAGATTTSATVAAPPATPYSPFALVSAFLQGSAQTAGSPEFTSPFALEAAPAETAGAETAGVPEFVSPFALAAAASEANKPAGELEQQGLWHAAPTPQPQQQKPPSRGQQLEQQSPPNLSTSLQHLPGTPTSQPLVFCSSREPLSPAGPPAQQHEPGLTLRSPFDNN